MTTTVEAPPGTLDVSAVVHRAKEEAGGEHEAAVALLVQWAREDNALYMAITATTLERRCRELVRSLNSRDRERAWLHGTGTVTKAESLNGQDIDDLRAGVLMTYVLPNGRTLGKATIVDLREAETYYAKREQVYRRDRLFIATLLVHVKKGQLVEDALTDGAVHELMLEAAKESESAP